MVDITMRRVFRVLYCLVAVGTLAGLPVLIIDFKNHNWSVHYKVGGACLYCKQMLVAATSVGRCEQDKRISWRILSPLHCMTPLKRLIGVTMVQCQQALRACQAASASLSVAHRQRHVISHFEFTTPPCRAGLFRGDDIRAAEPAGQPIRDRDALGEL